MLRVTLASFLCLVCLGPVLRAAEEAKPAVKADAEVFTREDCLDCHSDPTQTRKREGKTVQMDVVNTNQLMASVHAKLNCVDCHRGIKDLVHPAPLPPAQCSGCHTDAAGHDRAQQEYEHSIHGASRQLGSKAAASCADCHGGHGILKVKDTGSPVYKLNLPRTCARCHSNTKLTKDFEVSHPEAAGQYMDSIHGNALLKKGLIVAPGCTDCHGVHDIKRRVDEGSSIHGGNVAKTCGKCHLGVEQIYDKSVHGQLVAKGDPRGPVCSDCHNSHAIEAPRSGHFKMQSDQRCGRCHEDRLTHYRDTYHGKAMALGKQNIASDVAACYDCHGHHDVLPPSDPASRLSKDNILGTCQQCHPKATVGFTQYIPHANPLDRKNYPTLHLAFVLMTGLLIGVFAFFGTHTFLWLFRSGFLLMSDSKKFREAKIETQQGGEWFTRFEPFHRFLHFLVVTSFLLLVITGMPLKFFYTDWAKALFALLGGPEVARYLHRFGAVITFIYFGLHLVQLAVRSWFHRAQLRDPATGEYSLGQLFKVLLGPDSMIPTLQDWRDFIAHQKWFFGKGEKPQFDRWTYWEKFDYFSVFWGVAIIGFSGLIMWFPEFFTQYLPGWVINIALIVHSDEALLAAGFIFTIHFFNTHFRLEKFPMDTVIFSGRVSKTEMLHERKRWYDRLLKEKRLDQYRIKDEWERWRSIARTFGYGFFGLGVVLLILIVYAMISRLFH